MESFWVSASLQLAPMMSGTLALCGTNGPVITLMFLVLFISRSVPPSFQPKSKDAHHAAPSAAYMQQVLRSSRGRSAEQISLFAELSLLLKRSALAASNGSVIVTALPYKYQPYLYLGKNDFMSFSIL